MSLALPLDATKFIKKQFYDFGHALLNHLGAA
jgi:hypothetical protein